MLSAETVYEKWMSKAFEWMLCFLGENVNKEVRLVYLTVDSILSRTCKIILLMKW